MGFCLLYYCRFLPGARTQPSLLRYFLCVYEVFLYELSLFSSLSWTAPPAKRAVQHLSSTPLLCAAAVCQTALLLASPSSSNTRATEGLTSASYCHVQYVLHLYHFITISVSAESYTPMALARLKSMTLTCYTLTQVIG